MAAALYRGMDRATLDAAYANGKAVVEWPDIQQDWRRRSAETRARHPGHYDVRYGDGPRQRLDFLPGRSASDAMLVFVHGGYWQWNDKDDFTFVAEGARAAGLAIGLIEYTLAPEGRIGGMITEIEAGLAWLANRVATAEGRQARFVLAGHSAGAHLAEHLAGSPAVAAVLAISGVYDLEPVSLSFLDEALQLTPDEVTTLSPLRAVPPGAPLLLSVGALELPELIRQSDAYEAAARAAGRVVTRIPAPGRNHFTILEDLADPHGMLLAAALDALA